MIQNISFWYRNIIDSNKSWGVVGRGLGWRWLGSIPTILGPWMVIPTKSQQHPNNIPTGDVVKNCPTWIHENLCICLLTIYRGALFFLYSCYTVPSIKTERMIFQTWIVTAVWLAENIRWKWNRASYHKTHLGQGTMSEAPCSREASVPATLPKQW